jgi:hyperosmotically inducible periplasmic protein
VLAVSLQSGATERDTAMHRLAIPAAFLGAVLLSGCQTATGRTAGALADDDRTTAAVKSKLVADRSADLTSVGVDTADGVTRLTGVVDTGEQRLRAEQFAWDVSGVRQVVNDIQVRRSPETAVPSAPAAPSAPRRAIVGTVSSVDLTRGQVTVASGNEQLLLQLPAAVLRDLRPGDHLTLDVSPRAAR